MITEFNKAKDSAKAIVEKAKAENRAMTAEEKQEYDRHFNRANEIKELLSEEKKINTLELDKSDDITSAIFQTYNRSLSKGNMSNDEAIKEAIKEFGRTGDLRKYSTIGLISSTNSGVLMPRSVPLFSPIRQPRNAIRRGFQHYGVPTLLSSTTDNAKVPFLDDSSNVAANDNEGAAGTVKTPATAEGNLDLVEYQSGGYWLSQKVVRAQEFDVTQFVVPALLSRNERAEEEDWIEAMIADTNIHMSLGATVTYEAAVAFDESLNANYEGVGQFYVVSPDIKSKLRTLKDDDGRYFKTMDNALPTLFDKPVFTSSNLEAVSAGNIVALLVSTENVFIRDTTANSLERYEGESGHPGMIGHELISWASFAYSVKAVKAWKVTSS